MPRSHLSSRSTDPNSNKNATANTTSLTSAHAPKDFLRSRFVLHQSSRFPPCRCPSQNSWWEGARTKAFFFHHRQCASPPSTLPGIPESILAIENVKNEEKAEEGTMSAAAGRVLSRRTDIPQSPGGKRLRRTDGSRLDALNKKRCTVTSLKNSTG